MTFIQSFIALPDVGKRGGVRGRERHSLRLGVSETPQKQVDRKKSTFGSFTLLECISRSNMSNESQSYWLDPFSFLSFFLLYLFSHFKSNVEMQRHVFRPASDQWCHSPPHKKSISYWYINSEGKRWMCQLLLLLRELIWPDEAILALCWVFPPQWKTRTVLAIHRTAKHTFSLPIFFTVCTIFEVSLLSYLLPTKEKEFVRTLCGYDASGTHWLIALGIQQ